MEVRNVPEFLQGVNKVATSVQLRFDVRNSPSLESGIKERLIKLAGSRITEEGILIIQAKRYRTQDQNRADAILKLTAIVQKALIPPKNRKATRPTRVSKEERLEGKRMQSAKKHLRQQDKKGEDW